MKKWLILAGVALLGLSCGKKNPQEPEKDPEIAVVSVSVLPPSAELNAGETLQLNVTILPENATDKKVTWSSSAPAVATVTETGLVSAVASGSADIKATCGGKTAICVITVKKQIVAATEVKLDKTGVTLYENESIVLSATVLPEETTDKTVVWSSSAPDIASVDGGTVLAIQEGSATITATCGAAFGTCQITVKKPEVPVTSVTLDASSLSLLVGESKTLIATVLPEDASNPTVLWTSSDNGVATVENGIVTALAAGKCTISAKAGSITAICEIAVKEFTSQDNEGTNTENWN